MNKSQQLLATLEAVFAKIPKPPLREIISPYWDDEVESPFVAFEGHPDWRDLHVASHIPDGLAHALYHFQPWALRYYLPAYLRALLNGLVTERELLSYFTLEYVHSESDNPTEDAYGDRTYWPLVSNFALLTVQERSVVASVMRWKLECGLPPQLDAQVASALAGFWELPEDQFHELKTNYEKFNGALVSYPPEKAYEEAEARRKEKFGR